MMPPETLLCAHAVQPTVRHPPASPVDPPAQPGRGGALHCLRAGCPPPPSQPEAPRWCHLVAPLTLMPLLPPQHHSWRRCHKSGCRPSRLQASCGAAIAHPDASLRRRCRHMSCWDLMFTANCAALSSGPSPCGFDRIWGSCNGVMETHMRQGSTRALLRLARGRTSFSCKDRTIQHFCARNTWHSCAPVQCRLSACVGSGRSGDLTTIGSSRTPVCSASAALLESCSVAVEC